ncbi:DUF4910 domain-containing protein [Candidatus Desulfovibrio trichonymphae]|uniref:DUF4910 domain-containing protein n=1 Tax=Candidatus Desulfovibrio trichonymphae TaxID=1725232 RepID=UPI0018D53315|nr:DUF4910 domain-containing protein [Candidatus Desulfovibrio trichonymphae]
MKERVVAGFNLTCMGDERAYSYLSSRKGGTLADRGALHVLKHFYPDFARYSFLDRESDERQYCAPGIDLPLCSVMRTKYNFFPDYHTLLDNFDLVTEKGLVGGYTVMRQCLEALEENVVYSSKILCEPLAYIDGRTPLLELADIINLDIFQCAAMSKILLDKGVSCR